MIVITGANDGLGKALAELYILAGKKVVGVSRRECRANVTWLQTDLLKTEDIEKTAEKINNMDEPLEALINCAGILSIEKLEAISTNELHKALQTNVAAPVLLTSRLMKKIKHDGTDIVNVASTVGTKAYPDQAAYGASKWALRGFSANLQVELKSTPCRVISFCPGGFKTKLFTKATGIDNTQDGSQWMSVEDVAKCLKQLLDLPKNMEVSEIIINRK